MSTETVQYRVVGQPNSTLEGVEFPPYDFTWTDQLAAEHGYESARVAALDFRDRVGINWAKRPIITRRVIEISDWENVYGDGEEHSYGGQGELIPGSRCPRCRSPMEYNGNYRCSECPWVLPEDGNRAEVSAFNLAYVLLMEQRGEEPDLSVLE